jgi:ABC-type transport system involved in cytochrome c biogenesis permease subunit
MTLIAYACFALAFGTALIYLLMTFGRAPKRIMEGFGVQAVIIDKITYKSIAIGFSIFTLGIIFGAIWSDQAWGVYWSWDPKEIWSLITWAFYASFLIARRVVGQESVSKTYKMAAYNVMISFAVMAIIGFLVVSFAYIGVTLLLTSEVQPYGSP